MRALVFNQWQTEPELQDVPTPTPGPGEVLLKVAGAGACHSDISVYRVFDAETALPQLAPSYILGHENSGWVAEVGEGVTGFNKGEAYLVYGPMGCGRCPACSRGQDTYCHNAADVPHMASGLGRDGGMAEYLVVPARNLVPLGDADPIAAAPLSDAALTPYHAIKKSLPELGGANRTALAIGLGGLGQMGVQILKALTGATIIATDIREESMAKAREYGAITVASGPDQVEKIREITGGRGVDAVFDFVGISSTMELAAATVAQQGRISIVGVGGGDYVWNFFKIPYEVDFTSTYWGTIEELHEVAALYRAGKLEVDVEYFSLEDSLEAYRKLEAGEIAGRAVITPHGR